MHKLISNRLFAHDLDFVCDLLSPHRLQSSQYLDARQNSARDLLGIILEFVVHSDFPILRYTQSQRLQELFFFTLLNGNISSYLEAGANDGILYSNTFALYSLLNCRGISIEASPRLYQFLVKNRPNDINLNFALASNSGEQLTLLTDNSHGLFGRLAEPSRQSLSGANMTNKELVPSITINDVLSKYSLPSVSFMSLDIEGYELNALSALTAPVFHVACIEANSSAKIGELSAFLESIGCSCYYYPFASNEVVAISDNSGINPDLQSILSQYYAI